MRAHRASVHSAAVHAYAHFIVTAIRAINRLRVCVESRHATLDHNKHIHATLEGAVQADDNSISSNFRRTVYASRFDATFTYTLAAALTQMTMTFINSTNDPSQAVSGNDLGRCHRSSYTGS